jgi:hypothetical protein
MEVEINEGSTSILAFPFDWEIMEGISHSEITTKQKLQILAARFRDRIARSRSERFIQGEGTFYEVENPQASAALKAFAAELGLISWPQIDRLLSRLELLKSVAPEEGEPLKTDSLTEFLRFLASHSWARYPQTTVTPRGNLRAEWRVGRRKHFASEFLGNGQCVFVMFCDDLADPEIIARISGIVSVKSLLDNINPHDVLRWTNDGE